MIELLIEILAGGIFEIFAELFAWVGRERDRDKATDPRRPVDTMSEEPTPWSPVVQETRSALTIKLMIGAAGGAFWGYYVGTSSDVDWPLTFWSFAAIGVFALLCRMTGVSNEKFTQRIDNRILRALVTFRPERFGSWAMLSFVVATGVAGGFLLATRQI